MDPEEDKKATEDYEENLRKMNELFDEMPRSTRLYYEYLMSIYPSRARVK